MTSNGEERSAKRAARWKQFSLRTFLILTSLFCIALGIWSVYVKPFRDQEIAQKAALKLGAQIEKTPAVGGDWHRWLVTTTLGPEGFVYVTHVDLTNQPIDDAQFSRLAGLRYLEHLRLDRTNITDQSAPTLATFRRLEFLSVRYTDLSDDGTEGLLSMPNLQTLYLTGTHAADGTVERLSQLPELRAVYVRWTDISERDAARLATSLPACAVYHHLWRSSDTP